MDPREQQPDDESAELAQLQRSLASVYKLERRLFRRGTAVVYQATELNPPRPVLLRFFHPEVDLRAAAPRFKDVARLAMALNHPYIVPIYRVGFRAGIPYFIATKLVEGHPLDEIIGSQGALPMPTILAVLRTVATALTYAHGRNTTHGALSGASILVDREGRVFLWEFGFARVLEEVAPSVALPRVRCPVEAAGGAPSPAGDQYSLGILALEMLAGSLPDGADPQEFLREVRAARVALPEALLKVAQTTLVPDPAQRFASSSDLVTAIRAIPFSDADGRDASSLLGKLSRGEPVPKLRVVTATPAPASASAAAAPRAAAPRTTVSAAPRPPATRVAAAAPPPPAAKAPAAPAAGTTRPVPRSTVAAKAPAPPAAQPPRPAPRATTASPAPSARTVQTPRPAAPPPPPRPPAPPPPRRASAAAPAPPVPEEEELEPALPELESEPAELPEEEEEAAEEPAREAYQEEPEEEEREEEEEEAVEEEPEERVPPRRSFAARPPRPAPMTRPPAPPRTSHYPAPRPFTLPTRPEPQRKRGSRVAVFLVAGLLVVAALAGGAYWLGRRATPPSVAQGPTEPSTSARATPTPSAQAPAPAAAESTRTDTARAAPTPSAPTPRAETPRQAQRSAAAARADSARRAARQAQAAAAPAEAAGEPGLLLFGVEPATADIRVDGRRMGSGGFVDGQVPAGRHRVQITAPGFQPFDTTVTVRAGETLELGRIALLPVGGGTN